MINHQDKKPARKIARTDIIYKIDEDWKWAKLRLVVVDLPEVVELVNFLPQTFNRWVAHVSGTVSRVAEDLKTREEVKTREE